jgi:hypothetical protein
VVRDAFHRFDARLTPSGAPRTLVEDCAQRSAPLRAARTVSLPRLGSGRHTALVTGLLGRLSALG